MFGESESESPRVPSPWDSLISIPPSSVPSRASPNPPGTHPSSLNRGLIPRLVPENDEGNVEYKLQLLSPSPARFARLVTQLKWRLLEGGGQAYYELGVADSGALVGLPRAELEESLETLEMMAGEIGASVIVVKEIEVPAVIAGIAASHTDSWNGQRKQRAPRPGIEGSESSASALTNTSTTETETETEHSTVFDFDDGDLENMSTTIVLERSNANDNITIPSPHLPSPIRLFSMDTDSDPDPADNADVEQDDEPIPHIAIDLEISSVFKPRPMRTRTQILGQTPLPAAKTKRLKKIKHITDPTPTDTNSHEDNALAVKAHNRRAMRDRKREEKRRALLAYALTPVSGAPLPASATSADDGQFEKESPVEENSQLVSDLAALHVSVDAHEIAPLPLCDEDANDDDIDLFPSSLHTALIAEAPSPMEGNEVQTPSRSIVEALVVRKMSLDEAFLDFEGFG